MPKEPHSAITGDVAATSEVTLNTKGGSMTATLKKPLREKLGERGKTLAAATMEFEGGQAVLLLSAGGSAALPVRVRRVGKNRFEVALDAGEDEDVSELTAAFLRLKRDQFAKNQLRLTEPVTADGWRAKVAGKLGGAEAVRKKAAGTGRRG